MNRTAPQRQPPSNCSTVRLMISSSRLSLESVSQSRKKTLLSTLPCSWQSTQISHIRSFTGPLASAIFPTDDQLRMFPCYIPCLPQTLLVRVAFAAHLGAVVGHGAALRLW